MSSDLHLLGRMMRYARAAGYRYERTDFDGDTDYRWRGGKARVVTAQEFALGWKISLYARADLWPLSVQELADIVVATGYLPAEWSSAYTAGVTSGRGLPVETADAEVTR